MSKTRSSRADAQYDAPERIVMHNGALAARIDGADGRTDWLSSSAWPAPDLHLPFLRAFVHGSGPGTRRRSSLVARASQWSYREFLAYLAKRLGENVKLDDIGPADIRAYRDQLSAKQKFHRTTELRSLTLALYELGLCQRDLFEAASEFAGTPQHDPNPGYSPELIAAITAAATVEVEAIIERIGAGESLLRRFREEPMSLSPAELTLGTMLSEMASTGKPPQKGQINGDIPAVEAAKMLFLTIRDLTPIMILLAIRTGRNSETLKELTSVHRVREEQVLETQTIKRRRGYESEMVLWEIGGPTRRLRTAGGVYLVVHELCRRSRELAGSDRLLCVFVQRDGGRHRYVWENRINNVGGPDLPGWSKQHGFLEGGEPLRLTFNRIKTTVDRDRARKNNFNLDRAAVTNSPEVLYRSYISPDPTARRALESITHKALVDLEVRLTSASSPEKVAPISARFPITDEPDAVTTGFMSCRNVLGNPKQPGVECDADFLACFACPCAVVGDENIPTIMRLSLELVDRFDRLPLDTWIERYGQAWLAIHNDILPSRTPEELAHFGSEMPAETALALLEDPEMF